MIFSVPTIGDQPRRAPGVPTASHNPALPPNVKDEPSICVGSGAWSGFSSFDCDFAASDFT
jgi:hypothetical protein